MNTAVEQQNQMSWLSHVWQEYRSILISFLVLTISLLAWKLNGGETVFPQSWIDNFSFAAKVDEFDKFMRPMIQPTTRSIAAWCNLVL